MPVISSFLEDYRALPDANAVFLLIIRCILTGVDSPAIICPIQSSNLL